MPSTMSPPSRQRASSGLTAAPPGPLPRPDRHRRRPQAMEKDDPRRFLRRMREVVGRVAGARWRSKAGVQRGLMASRSCSAWLMHVRIAAGLHRQVGPVGDGEFEHVRRPAQPARAGHGLPERRAGADLGRRCGESVMRPFGASSTLAKAASAPVPKSALDAAEPDAVVFPGVRGVVGPLARRAVGPQRMRPRLFQHGLGALSCRAGPRPGHFFMPVFNTLRSRNSIGSRPSLPAISSTIISVAAKVSSAP